MLQVIRSIEIDAPPSAVWRWLATQQALRRWISADPHAWVGQEAVEPSTAPSAGVAGLQPRPLVLRGRGEMHPLVSLVATYRPNT